MPSLIVRHLEEETHRALKYRASQNGRSTEAEVRLILKAAVEPTEGFGTMLTRLITSTDVQSTAGSRRSHTPIEFPRIRGKVRPAQFD